MLAAFLVGGYILCCVLALKILARAWYDDFGDLKGAPLFLAFGGPISLVAAVGIALIYRHDNPRPSRFLLGSKRVPR